MPIFSISTNLPASKIPADFVTKTVDVVAKTLSKPKSYVVVEVNPDKLMSWGGTSDPAARAVLSSIGQLGKEANKKHSAVLYQHIQDNLGIAGDRLYIEYVDLNKQNVGYQGTTFDDLL